MSEEYLKLLQGLMVDEVMSSEGVYYSIGSTGQAPQESQRVVGRQLRVGPYTLSITNEFRVEGLDELEQTVGLRILAVDESDSKAILELERSVRIIVDLRDEAYRGPEAMVLHGPNNLIVVWN